MAACRTRLGLRRRGPRLRSAALLTLALAAGLLPACVNLTEREAQKQALVLYQENADQYYDRGSYAQALDQADKALELDEDLEDMHLIRAYCLLKIGRATGNVDLVDESLEVFAHVDDEFYSGWFEDKRTYRLDFGRGSAHLARVLMHDGAINKIRSKLESQYLAGDARRTQEKLLADEQEARTDHLNEAEAALRRVLVDDLQADNAYAYLELTLVLNAQGGREDEVIASGHRAIELLQDSNETWRRIQQMPNRSPTAKLNGQMKMENNLQKEKLLRDLLATVHFNNGDIDAYLDEIARMEARKLMTEAQYFNRADVWASRGDYGRAIDDLEMFLRLRARYLDYEDDDMAPLAFKKLDELRTRLGQQPTSR